MTWILDLGGFVHIDFIGYDIKTSMGCFIILCAVSLWLFSLAYRAIKSFINTPKSIATYQDKKNQKRGLQALAYGLSAVAAGDAKSAHYYAKRTSRFLKNDFGLSALLSGLTARLNNDDQTAIASYNSLIQYKETSFLGLKGLMQIAMEKGDYRYAKVLAEKAYNQSPKHPWVSETYYATLLKTKHFEKAYSMLPQLKKLLPDNKDQWIKDETIFTLQNGDAFKAYKINPTSLPALFACLDQWAEKAKRRKSINHIKKAWTHTPHPHLLDIWIKYAPKKTNGNIPAMVSWIEDLHRNNVDDASSALYIAETLLRLNQNEHATRFLKQAMAEHPTGRAYQLMHRIDPLGGWLENMTSANQDKAWVCTKTGKIYSDWSPTNDDGDFNTIEWCYPEQRDQNSPALSSGISLFDAQVA